jgi:CysZ protein
VRSSINLDPMNTTSPQNPAWVNLSGAVLFLLRHPGLLMFSLGLVSLTALLSWLGFTFIIAQLDTFFTDLLKPPPPSDAWWAIIIEGGWQLVMWFYLLVSRLIGFYLCFLLAYTLSSPLYSLLSEAVERATLVMGTNAIRFSPRTLLLDIKEGVKLALMGIGIAVASLVIGLVPLFGPVLVLIIYIFYTALLFIDFPAANRHWALRRKIRWLQDRPRVAIRLGTLPALIGMIPVVNIFIMALLFPLLVVQATLNFVSIEE